MLCITTDSVMLIIFYRAEREAQETVSHERRSKLLVDNSDSEEENQGTLSQPLRELCSTVDAFIYVAKGSDKTRGTHLTTLSFMIDTSVYVIQKGYCDSVTE